MKQNVSCFPLDAPQNPLHLHSAYRDYFGDAHARLAELIEPILAPGCYVPRIYHAPDSATENLGVEGGGFLEYALALPPASFILGFLHTFTSLASADAADPPVGSGFKFQLTDMERKYRFFGKPMPEAYLLNDMASSNPQSPLAAGLYVLNPSVRLLTAPYPVAPPGMFKLEFWNSLPTVNTLVRLSLLLAVLDPNRFESKEGIA